MIASVLEVFTAIGSWFVTTISSMLPIFYNTTDNSLTFLGVMALASVAVGIVLLVYNFVKDFLKFR